MLPQMLSCTGCSFTEGLRDGAPDQRCHRLHGRYARRANGRDHVGGREGAVGSLSVLGPSRSSVTAIARVAGTTSEISAAAVLHDRVSDDVLPLTQEALAQLLGVRRTTVTPTMSKLRAAGAIRSDRRGFVEIDRARLDSVACEC